MHVNPSNLVSLSNPDTYYQMLACWIRFNDRPEEIEELLVLLLDSVSIFKNGLTSNSSNGVRKGLTEVSKGNKEPEKSQTVGNVQKGEGLRCSAAMC